MKAELLIVDEKLALIVKKQDIKNDYDKEIIARIVSDMYFTHSITVSFTKEEIQESLSKIKQAYICFIMEDSYDPDVRVIGYTTEQFKALKMLNEKIHRLKSPDKPKLILN
ncbi:hypothetical protein FE314_26510 (plasmid) [Priestia megaterium]|uniref:hypothetical protein n=1 Tax=Priestia megaterium TaxID=1404 RepID=UPI0006F5C897|nr:hypothetical protein [Priestia megaterium]KAA8747768.1 hypothetical protein FE314_26510 [Priestia megaterium]KQU14767.1 hypothetical protein ASG61_29835 [Bacillus sp. Leaf75]